MLREKYFENKDTLDGKLSQELTYQDKQAAWDSIAESITALGTAKRTSDQAKKKMENLMSRAKSAFATQRRE